jgi:hypothetical protein
VADNQNPYMTLANEDKMASTPAQKISSGGNPYMDMAQEDLSQAQQRLKGVLDVVSPVNPDQAAEAMKLSRSSGLPQDTVQANLDEVRRRERVRLLNAQKMMADSPVLARQLMDPNFAKIAHDNVGQMSSLEMAASYLTRSLGSGALNLTAAATKLANDALGTPEQDIAVLFKNDPAKLKEVLETSPSTALIRWAKDQQKLANQIMTNAPDAVKARYGNLEYFTADTDNAAYLSPVKMMGDALQSLPTTLALMFSAYVTKGRAATEYSNLIAAGATREVALKQATVVAADTMAKFSALSEGTFGYAQQYNQTRAEVDKIKQAQLEQSPQYQQLLQQGFTPESARTYLSAFTAQQAGTLAGVIDGITNFYGGKVLGRVIGEGGALLPRLGKGFATEALTEMPQSMGEQFAQNLATQKSMNPDQSLSEGVAEAGAAGFFVGGLTGATFSGVFGRAQRDQEDAGKANVMFDLLGKINDMAAANKVRERDVDSFEGFLQSVEQDQEGPVNTLYIEPRTLVDTLLASGANIGELKASLPSLAKLDESLQAGTELAIPVSEFASRMAGTEYAQALLPHFKTDPNGMSKVQADEYMQTHGEKLQADVEKVLADSITDEKTKVSAENVRQFMTNELTATGYTKDVVDPMAALWTAFYTVNAARSGKTPEQFAKDYPPPFVNRQGFTGDSYDQSGNLKIDTENFKNWFKQSAVSDGGKPIVVYTGTSKDVDFTSFKVPKNGTWFSTDTEAASMYAKENDSQDFKYDPDTRSYREVNTASRVMPVYLSIQNPYKMTAEDLKAVNTENYKKAQGQFFDKLRAQGYDGVDMGGGVWVVLQSPTQIKSVFNNGDFNPKKANTLFQEEDAKEDAASDDVSEGTQSEVPDSVDDQSVLDNALKVAKSQVWNKGRDLKMAIQQAVQAAAQAAGVDVSLPSPQTTDYLVRVGVKDALMALKQNANAIGWYDLKTRQALGIMALVHPEIAKDENSRFAFVWALAVTSNGMKVGKNFELAEQAYVAYKRDGVMPTDIQAGQAQKAINKSMALFNELEEKWGIDDLRRFMLTNFTVGEISALSKKLKPGGEHAATMVKGAAILGPKIGNGFFSNLYGNFDALTMDRWLVRTWGRWTGTLIKPQPNQTANARDRLTAARDAVVANEAEAARIAEILGQPVTADTSVDELAVMVQEASMDPELRAKMNESEAGLELRKAGNSLAKYLDGQKEAPAGPNERNYIRDVFSQMLAELQSRPEYANLTMADLQAVLWYAEKRLYETAKEDVDAEDATEGYNDEEAPDYANAAADVARAKGVSDRKIKNALKKEEQNGRSGDARSEDAGERETQAGEQGQAQGFTRTEKRLFIGAAAVHRVRSYRAGGGGESGSYTRAGGEGRGKPRVLKKLGVTYTEEWKPGKFLGTVFRANGITTPKFYELAQGDEKNAQRFADAITESKKASGAVGAAVYVYPVEDYKGMRLYLSEDGKSGVAVKPDGDIVSVFSNGGAGRSVLELAIAAGGTKLDAFDTILPPFYAAHGFVTTSRLTWDDSQSPDGWDKAALKGYNNGEPDVVFMALDQAYMGGYTGKDGRRYEGENAYDSAVNAQTRAVRKFARAGASYNQEPTLLAPNGKPSNLSPVLHALVRTPEFKAWFGDWEKFATMQGGVWNDDKGEVSKAVDENGEPLVVYHGTDTGGFVEFNTPSGTKRGDLGIFLTPNRSMAATYVKRGRGAKDITRDQTGEEADRVSGVYPLFVNIRTPYETDFENAYWNGERPGQYVVLDEDGQQLSTDDGTTYFKMFDDANTFALQNGGTVEAAPDHFETTDSAVSEARRNGDDGAIIRNVVDDGGGASSYAGEPTDVFVAFDSTQIKSVENFGTFNPNDPNIYKQGEDTARGKITFPAAGVASGPSVITLFKSANLSTFLHESGHFFLEVTADMAAQPNAPQEIREDMDKILRFFGVPDLATWQAMDIEQKRPLHEKFARGFEAYLFEGRSPNLEMAGIFQRFRAWMLNVYKQIKALNVELDDEIRGVFDRMLASNEAIIEAEQARKYVAMFTAKPPFMTDDEWREYQQSDLEASQAAVDNLQTRSLRDMRWLTNAKARILKQMQKDAAAQRKDVRREVEAEVMAEPVYAAREFLKRGTLNGQQVEGGYKLSLPEIEELYKDSPILGSIKKALGFGKYGMLAAENAIHPQQVAELFGFSSPDHLVRSLMEAPDPRTVIEQRTDQRMLERYGDLNSPEAMNRAADEAIHNDARAKFVATEANALAKATGRPKILQSAARAFAQQIISRLKIREIRPGQYAASAARAARNAAKPGIDLIEAATEKRNQLINTYAAKYAYEAQRDIERGIRYLRKFDGKNIYKVMHPDYVEQIHALLERFDLRVSTSGADIDKRRALVQWVESERAKGNEPVVPQKLLDEAFRTSYKELSLEDFKGLIDTVRNIEHLGRLKDKLLKIQDQREFRAVVAEASESINDNAYKDVDVERENKGIKNWVVSNGREILAWHRKFASLVRQMDGFKDGGPLWRIFLRLMNEAATQEASMREQAAVKLAALYKGLGKVNLNKKTYIPEIGASLSLEGRLAVALNMGNETNMRRVMEGEGWNPAQVNAIVGTLTREQWNFVQGVWDMLNSYWPEISAKERRMTGLTPEKVESRPFTITLADGTQMALEGGYYPIKYNPARSSKAEADTAAEVLKQMERGLYTRAQTARGHLESRVQSVNRPMRYDLGVIDQHLNQVIHDLSWHEYLVDANRLLRADPVDNAIREHYGPEVLSIMRKTMEDIAIGELPAVGSIERGVRWIRGGVSIASMGWSLITAIQQPTGLAQSVKRIGAKWVAKGASRWLRDAASMENTAAWVNEKSEFMRLRSKTQQREISEIRNTIYKGETMSAVQGSFFYLVAKLQMVADMPTWLGMYEKAMAEGKDEPSAIALADQAVLDSQGGGQIKDLSQVQKGGEWQKLWTNFYSYFNVTYNLLAESVNETRKVGPSRLPLLAIDVLMLTVVPATLGFLIKAAVKNSLGDDDDEELAKKLVAENLSYLMGTMIGLRELNAVVSGSMGYEGPAGARFFADVAKFAKQVEQGDADEAFFRAANSLGGVLLHYPSGQIERTVRGMVELSEGNQSNPLGLLFGPAPKQ